MSLLDQPALDLLLANGRRQAREPATPQDPMPVVKLFTPDGGGTWLVTEIDPDDPDLAFGLCDLGLGCPELGYVRLAELALIRGRLGLPIERDLHFRGCKPISTYAQEARRVGRIVT